MTPVRPHPRHLLCQPTQRTGQHAANQTLPGRRLLPLGIHDQIQAHLGQPLRMPLRHLPQRGTAADPLLIQIVGERMMVDVARYRRHQYLESYARVLQTESQIHVLESVGREILVEATDTSERLAQHTGVLGNEVLAGRRPAGKLGDAAGVEHLRRAVEAVRVEPSITAYITGIVRATREAASLTLGASPRAGVALLKTGRALALLEGRQFVIPDDVPYLAPAVLRHRVNVAPELELEGVTPDLALKSVLEQVEVPTT